ncbi:MAG: HAD family hydrolase, partial [Planctomycetota bacterium]
VMVGDFRFDLEAGRAAGCLTVHVDPAGAFPWPELADLKVRGLAELLAALEAG